MSWLFGLRKDPNSLGSGVPPVEGGRDDNNEKNPSQQSQGNTRGPRPSEAYRFDSSALERAAEAAKELEKSSKIFITSCIYSCVLEMFQKYNLSFIISLFRIC